MKSEKMCVYCGNVCDNPTKEHILPLGCFQWAYMIEKEEVRERFEGVNERGVNVFYACYNCNHVKGGKILSEEEIDELFVSGTERQAIRDFHKKHKEAINLYKNLVALVLMRQYRRCALCHSRISYYDYNFRKRYHDLERSENNCVALCNKCVGRWQHARSRY